MKRVLIGAVGTMLIAGLSGNASAGLITYQVFNHPDGSQISDGTNTDGYILRLDVNGVNTFNANNTSGVFFSFDPLSNQATMSGLVTHNESGDDTNVFDAKDDVWRIDAVFEDVTLTDNEMPTWFAGEDPNLTFDDMIEELLNDGNDPDTPAEMSTDFSGDVARIYFELVNLTLTQVDGMGDGFTYMGPFTWDEFPNNPEEKQLFLQRGWRLWDHPDQHKIGGAGWLEEDPGGGPDGCCQDLLFILGNDPDRDVPEPGSATLFVLGSTALIIVRRRRKR